MHASMFVCLFVCLVSLVCLCLFVFFVCMFLRFSGSLLKASDSRWGFPQEPMKVTWKLGPEPRDWSWGPRSWNKILVLGSRRTVDSLVCFERFYRLIMS